MWKAYHLEIDIPIYTHTCIFNNLYSLLLTSEINFEKQMDSSQSRFLQRKYTSPFHNPWRQHPASLTNSQNILSILCMLSMDFRILELERILSYRWRNKLLWTLAKTTQDGRIECSCGLITVFSLCPLFWGSFHSAVSHFSPSERLSLFL